MPVGVEVMLEAHTPQARLEVHAGVGLTVADPRRIRRRRKHDLFTIGEPARIPLIDEVIVAVVQLDDGVLARADVDAEVAEDALGVASFDEARALAEQPIEAVADYAVRVDLPAEIDPGGA